MNSTTVLVMGGGLAGLSCAVALAEEGFRVCLVEKRPRLGGRATSFTLPGGEEVDNCQHVTLGCCTNLADFYRRAGAESKIRFYQRLFFLDPRGRRGVIEAAGFPPPLHLAPSFALFPSLNFADKRAIARAMLHIAWNGGRPPGMQGLSMQEWLERQRQTPAAIETFWCTVLVSALNEELHRTDAFYGVDVFWKAFLANRRGFEVGIPTVPLAGLYDGCRVPIEQRGGEVRTRIGVASLRLAGEKVAAAALDSGSELHADYFVSALPHAAFLEMIPAALLEREPALAGVRNLEVSPITGVHFWFDRPVMREPFLTLLGRTTQWIFNKTLLSRQAASSNIGGQYLQLVISASYDLVALSRQQIINLCLRELHDALPESREARLEKATVIKEVSATFSPRPDCDRWRPTQGTALKNFFLAGDWTRTGWPATMEGAVRSGYLAAEAILAAEGSHRRLIAPDLPAEGFARW
ncbi:MAG: hydroxysqualene dehydroxylase HpnE [Candidatus Acidiferrales bacterium]